ncbi:MAG: hypothetical protein U0573_06740 [Phycisphaerales bacterium]|nr:hypothetical protein [Planctomycetota bacterium]
MVLRQTLAILGDAYRELNAKKMFWITLALSAFVVLAIACVGINSKGISVLWWTFPVDVFNTAIVSPALFYKLIFIGFGFKFWLTWAATILALISTASLIPDFVAGGSIDLMLSKPIARLRLFLTKYATGLLFVGLQVMVFSVASFLVIGIRGGVWDWKIFVAVPLVLLFFSYLYCVCVLIGIVTRSTIAALLLTVLFWFVLFLLHSGEQSLNLFKLNAEEQTATLEARAEPLSDQIAKSKAVIAQLSEAPTDETAEARGRREGELATKNASLTGLELRQQSTAKDLESYRASLGRLKLWHDVLFSVKTALPKTSETMELLQRVLTSSDETSKLEDAEQQRREERGTRRRDADAAKRDADNEADRGGPGFSPSVVRRQEEINRSRSVWWILGTSVAFEALVLAVACTIFVRRDF